jgi:hypothetical protein
METIRQEYLHFAIVLSLRSRLADGLNVSNVLPPIKSGRVDGATSVKLVGRDVADGLNSTRR